MLSVGGCAFRWNFFPFKITLTWHATFLLYHESIVKNLLKIFLCKFTPQFVEGIHLTLLPHIFSAYVKVWSMLDYESVEASSE